MNNVTEQIVGIFALAVGVAIVSVLVSTKSNTVGVIQSIASGFGNILGVATAPVTGAAVQVNTSYPTPLGSSYGASFPALPSIGAGY